MNKLYLSVICLAILLLNLRFSQTGEVYGQGMTVWEPNLTSFTDNPPVISAELLALSDSSVYSHPEFGLLPENAPCTDCSELIDQRTLNSRYFIQNGTNGNTFYKQTAFGDLHYYDESGNLISFDRRLKKIAPKQFIAKHQATPLMLDILNEETAYIVNGEKYIFNNELTLKNILPDGSIIILGIANWSNKTIGDHGIYITNVWPGIDMQIAFELNMVKSNFIIKTLPTITEGYLAITDQLVLPSGYAVGFGEGTFGTMGWNGALITASMEDSLYGFETGRAIAYDSKFITDKDSIGIHAVNPEYIYDPLTNKLTYVVAADWLNDPALEYPVTIDPIVTSSAMYGSLIKFRYNGEWCGGATYCSYILNVSLPPNCTVTAATFSSQYITVAGTCALTCWLQDAGFRMWSDSCDTYSPLPVGYFWTCQPAPFTGTCTAVNYDMTQMVSCLTPKCNGSIPFEMRTSYCYCNANGTCPVGAAVPCHQMNANSWSVTITGHNLETLGDVVDGSGAVTYNDAFCCDDFLLDPLPMYGVPPYTFLWGGFGGGGSTGSDTTVFSCSNGTYVYTCTVTDACNVVRVATFTLIVDNCLLPITLTNFEGEYKNGTVILEWTTVSEINNDYFVVERKTDGEYISIDVVDGNGQSTNETDYRSTDESPKPGTDYYRLNQFDINGDNNYSNPIAVEVLEPDIVPYPNPTVKSILFSLKDLDPGESIYITINNATGKMVFSNELQCSSSGFFTIPVESLSSGSYFATVVVPGKDPLHFQFIKQ
ncbi:MAG: T9SS type A sorting domain-containing protein [Chitinophagales bacterium]